MADFQHFFEQYNNQSQSEYKHILANILRSLFVARTPPVEARSPDFRRMLRTTPVGGRFCMWCAVLGAPPRRPLARADAA